MDDQAVRVVRHEGVIELELCRPELLNRFDMRLHRELSRLFVELGSDPATRCVLLSSTGKVFSAGGDTEVMLEAASDIAHRMAMIDEGRRLFRAVVDCPKPIVVALARSCYGLGTSVILAADAIVTAPAVEIADPHVRMGLVAGDGGCVAWPSAMGMVKAKRHLLTGDAMTGEEAYRLGVVSDLAANSEDVHPTALTLAMRIAGLPPLAVQMTKRALAKTLLSRAEEVLDLAFYLEALSFGTDDLLEAVAAFKEKRAGKWQGR